MPICKKFLIGACINQNCLYVHKLHPGPQRGCKYYERGFCKNGLNCPGAHIRRELCPNYLQGFCFKGPNCENVHLKVLIAPEDDRLESLIAQINKNKK